MIDTFGISMFCIFTAIIIFCVYKGFNPGKKEKEPEQVPSKNEDAEKFWKETKEEVEKELLQLLLPNDEAVLSLQRGLLEKESILVRGESAELFRAKTTLSSVTAEISRDFMGIWRIVLNVDINDWEDEVICRTESKTGLRGYRTKCYDYEYRPYSQNVNGGTLTYNWATWLEERLSKNHGFNILSSTWDIFNDREKRCNEIVFCEPDAFVNKFSVKGKPAEVYKQLLSFTEEMKTQLEKEYIDTVGFFSRKISDYISEKLLMEITVKELKGKSTIDLTQDQRFVTVAFLELDKNDFILKLRLKKPEVSLDLEVLHCYVKENLLNFFSDYGKPVEVIEEIPSTQIEVWNGRMASKYEPIMENEYSFTLRVKEIDGDLHS